MGLRSISLFSGIAGLDLGVKLACPDVQTVCYVERDEFCQRILQARMADGSIDDAPVWNDVTTFDGNEWRGQVDLLTGGFPCQDISNAGKRAGIDGERSGLWREYVRIIREVRPRLVFVENVSALLGRGLERVLGDLAESGFDAEWLCLRASDVGAPHRRERVFVLAYTAEQLVRWESAESPWWAHPGRGSEIMADTGGQLVSESRRRQERRDGAGPAGESVLADAFGLDCSGRRGTRDPAGAARDTEGEKRQRKRLRNTADNCLPSFPPGPADSERWRAVLDRWPELAPAIEAPPQSRVRGVADGTASRVDRLRALGNAVAPQQAALAFSILWRRMQEGVTDATP